jgi:hypothetical protein
MAEDDAADGAREEAERIGHEGEQGPRERLELGEEDLVENQGSGGAVEEEIVPFYGRADQARHNHATQRRRLPLLGSRR